MIKASRQEEPIAAKRDEGKCIHSHTQKKMNK